jgi:hypothetical protein
MYTSGPEFSTQGVSAPQTNLVIGVQAIITLLAFQPATLALPSAMVAIFFATAWFVDEMHGLSTLVRAR